MEITNKDVIWNYLATFLKIASSVILLPFILRVMPSETVGVWVVFMTITAFSSLLDFGFSPSFARNVTYVFSGVKKLKVNGLETVNTDSFNIDYGLLKGVISAMKWFYTLMAVVLFILLTTIGTYYIFTLLKSYNGNHQEVYIAWGLLCVISTYNLYTLYYDSLLQGRGLIMRSKQIVIMGQSVYLVIATVLIMAGKGLIAIVAAQASSVIVVRWLSYQSFFTEEIKNKLLFSVSRLKNEVLEAITPNAIKIGLTSLGGFMVVRSGIVIGSLFLSLDDIASYGVTMQIIGVIAGLSGIYTATFQPKIAQLRVTNNNNAIKKIYIKGQVVLLLTFFVGGLCLLFLGEWALNFMKSQTRFLPSMIVLFAVIISFLEKNHAIAGGVLLTSNEVPFFKSSLIAGGVTIILIIMMLHFGDMKLWALVLGPGIAHLYNNWKWPYEVYLQLNISIKDIKQTLNNIIKHE